MKLRTTEDVLLIVAFALIAAGLILGIGGWMWGLNTLSGVLGTTATPPGHVQTGISVVFICFFIATPMLIIGFLMLVVSVIVHFATKRKGHAN